MIFHQIEFDENIMHNHTKYKYEKTGKKNIKRKKQHKRNQIESNKKEEVNKKLINSK